MTEQQNQRRKQSHWALMAAAITLLLFLAALYGSEIHFGLIWDDPEWFGRVVGKSFWQLLQPSADFHFFRPGVMVYNRLFVKHDETLAVETLHWVQICWHLLNLALIFALSRRLGFRRWAAFTVIVLAGLHPFVYQSVAWAAPGQPLTAVLLNSAWVLYLMARSAAAHSRPRQLLLISVLSFITALSISEGAVPLAAMPLLFELALRQKHTPWNVLLIKGWRHPRQNKLLWPLLYPAAAILFTAFWLLVPKESGITSLTFDWRVYAYFLQGFVGFWASSAFAAWVSASIMLVVIWVGVVIGLWSLALAQKRGALATVGLIWAFLGIMPGLVGLPYSYVEIASRLFYAALPGAAWLWVCAFWPPETNRRRATAVLRISILAAVAWFGLATTIGFIRLFEPGTALMADMVQALGENGRYLIINYPDRYRLKEEPLPVGNWGVLLAPVVVDLAEFPALLHGSQAHTVSASMPWLDEAERNQGPYQIAMRGVILQPEALYGLAREQDGVFVARYEADGSFSLEYAGAVQPQMAETCGVALFDQTICLENIDLIPAENSLIIRSSWWTNAPPPPHLTIFTHLGQPGSPPAAQADSDSWQGALPLANWQPGDLIIDERRLPLPPDEGEWQVWLGVYNWVTGERLTAQDEAERPLPNNIVVIPLPQLGSNAKD